MVNESLINCPICSSEISSPGYSYQNDLYQGDAERLFSDLRIYFCSQCEIGFAYPFVGAKSLSEFYTSIYRSSSGAHSHQLENYSLADKYGQRAFSQLQLARTFWQKENMPEKILDVGAGHGYLLKVAQILFPTAKLFALEPDRHSLETLKKLGAHVFNLLLNENTVKEISEKFDLVVCSHVIEHYNANELHGFCRALQEILIPGGLAVIEVPWGEIPKYPDMRFNDAPHLSFFSENSLRYIMSKYFDVLFCSSAGPKVESNLIAYSRKNK